MCVYNFLKLTHWCLWLIGVHLCFLYVVFVMCIMFVCFAVWCVGVFVRCGCFCKEVKVWMFL
jgi:hypothetical protein